MTENHTHGTCIVDNYCERHGTQPEFRDERVNAITNGAFPVAALWALYGARSAAGLSPRLSAHLIVTGNLIAGLSLPLFRWGAFSQGGIATMKCND